MDLASFDDELFCGESARHSYKNRPEMDVVARDRTISLWAMLTRLYIEALLADEYLAGQVWELWDAGLIPDELAAIA